MEFILLALFFYVIYSIFFKNKGGQLEDYKEGQFKDKEGQTYPPTYSHMTPVQRCSLRFVRSVSYLYNLQNGMTPYESNWEVAKLYTERHDGDNIDEAANMLSHSALRISNGKQLPWIHKARPKGFDVDSVNKFDKAHLSRPLDDMHLQAFFDGVNASY